VRPCSEQFVPDVSNEVLYFPVSSAVARMLRVAVLYNSCLLLVLMILCSDVT
jgi:hypothetical protein